MLVQAQFLDRDHLLIALGHPDTVMARNMDVAPGLVFFVIYDMVTGTVRKVTSNNADGMMMAYMRHAPMFHAADIRNDWERYITPALVGLHPPSEQERVITRQWGYPVVSHLLSFAHHGPSNCKNQKKDMHCLAIQTDRQTDRHTKAS